MCCIDVFVNCVFIGLMLCGEYFVDLFEDIVLVLDWSFVWEGDFVMIVQLIDVFGVNYYLMVIVCLWDGVFLKQENDGYKGVMGGIVWLGSDWLVEFVEQLGFYIVMGWNIVLEGFEELFVLFLEQFLEQLFMVIENGVVFDDEIVLDGVVYDCEWIDYLCRYFIVVYWVLECGVDLCGYFVWLLFDNFEWGYGYVKCFGIVCVDFDLFECMVKDLGYWYWEFICICIVEV